MSSCAAAVISNEGRGMEGRGWGKFGIEGGVGKFGIKGGMLWGWLVNNYEGC